MRKELEKIVREAGQRMLSMQKQGLCIEKKAGIGNYVTDADVEVQRFLKERLERILPEADFIGEEAAKEGREAGLRWIVDPIDGTANYARGIPYCGISAALAEESKAVLGVVYNPYTGECYSAQEGGGAYRNGERIWSSKRSLQQSLVSVGCTAYSRELTEIMFDMFRRFFEHCEDIRAFGAAAPELCMTAAGMTDAFLEFHLEPWDYAAASCIIKEAGGRISDMAGKELPLDGPSTVLAAGEGCYEEALILCMDFRMDCLK